MWEASHKGKPKLKETSRLPQLLEKSYRVKSQQSAAWADAMVLVIESYSSLKSSKNLQSQE